jgi:multiple sugar transport system substrate-binding protein
MGIWSRATRRTRTVAVSALALVVSTGLLTGCGGEAVGTPDGKITVWSLENLPPRMAATNKVIDRFEEKSGVEVELVGVAENQLPQLIMSAAAAGNLPDVIGALPMGQVWQMHGNELLNAEVSTDIVRDLGKGTFDANALDLYSDGGKQLAVPSDAWLQILAYREDLFRQAGLAAPDTYGKVLKAAEKLNGRNRAGISMATDPGDVFTQQSFESVALANGCQMVNDADEVALDSPACRRAFATYGELAREHGAAGLQNVDSTRATYFAGRSPMIVWSSFLLDELAGLRDDALPSCGPCKGDREFLSDNSGVVTAMKGPDAEEPAQFGEITSWAVTRTAETGASRKFVKFMMSAGYSDWFGMSPEGKIPVRAGTAEDPDRYEQAWRNSEVGVDTRKPMDEAYSSRLLHRLLDGVGNMKRWGIAQGEGLLVGATNGELPVPKAVGAMSTGQVTPEEAAADADADVTALKESLE